MALPTTHPGVPIHLFTRHVLERHASDNRGFILSFEHIESLAANSPKKNVAALLPHNVEKNRYKNVLACEYYFYVFPFFHTFKRSQHAGAYSFGFFILLLLLLSPVLQI